ncbi:MAG TPA: PHP domain-containing protein [Legionellaceae bacterium]|nr:PHP domain-containing protein [Legionellaceae bacterium]
MIDLHCHSHHSDGLLSPTMLCERAFEAGMKMIALTDHDTTAGVQELMDAAKKYDLRVITGIELSVRWKKHDIHILGLNINLNDPVLNEIIEQQNSNRITRAQNIGSALQRCGLENAYQKACEVAGHDRIGRVHFAQILLHEGWVQEPKAAFKRYLGKGKIAYVPSSWINLNDAVNAIKTAGGQAVIAHPLKYGLTRMKLHELIHEFKAEGGEGIEVVSGEMMEEDIQRVSRLCYVFDLLASSGSDYHGEGISRIKLGRQKSLPDDCIPIWNAWS